MLVLVPVPIVYLGETDNKLAARSSYGTGYGLPVQPIAKFGVASPGFAFAQMEFQSGQGSRTNAGFWRAMTIQRARRQAPIPIVQVAVTKNPAASEFATEPAVDARFGAKWKMDRS